MPTIIASAVFPEVYLLTPTRYDDERGYFMEIYRHSWLDKIAPNTALVQENRSYSHAQVLRGLHYQLEQPQAKLIQVLSGRIFDVVVDLRQHSPTFGRWQGFTLSAEQQQQLWIPAGFAHGFYAQTAADCVYRCSAYYHAASERTLAWNDPDLAIHWPLEQAPQVSVKDQRGVAFAQADYFL